MKIILLVIGMLVSTVGMAQDINKSFEINKLTTISNGTSTGVYGEVNIEIKGTDSTVSIKYADGTYYFYSKNVKIGKEGNLIMSNSTQWHLQNNYKGEVIMSINLKLRTINITVKTTGFNVKFH